MSSQLAPTRVYKSWRNDGTPNANGTMATYAAGTTTPQATYTDSTGSTPNTNPIVFNARGEANVWFDPTLSYKLVEFDSDGTLLGTTDHINGSLSPSGDIIPSVDNAYNLGSTSSAWANLYLGANHEPAYSAGTGIIGYIPRTSGETTASITPTYYGYPPGDVRRYGAKLDGITDDTVAYQRAGLASLNPSAPSGSSVITGSIPLVAFQTWTFYGTNIVITGNTQVFTSTAVNDWAIVGEWSVTGDNGAAGATSGTGAALIINDSMRFFVAGLDARNIKGWGVLVQPGSSTSARTERGSIVGFRASACYIGFEATAGTGAEYCNIVAPTITRCNTGVKIAAGNTNVTGGSISDNTEGVYLVNGTNHAHGMFTGVNINHNTGGGFNVHADSVTNGHSFVGCHFYEGNIYLKACTGITFESCFLDPNAYYFEGGQNAFRNCLFPYGYTNTINNNYNATPSYTIWNNCKKTDLTNVAGAFGNINGLRVNVNPTALSFTPTQLTNQTDVVWSTSVIYSANNSSQTQFVPYAAGTGIFTCRGMGDGHVRVTAYLNVANNAADDMNNMYMYVRKNGAGVERYFDRMKLTTTKTIFQLDCIIEMNVTDTLVFRVAQTAGIVNNITLSTAESNVIVEGL